jgi:murein hydrolase activator
MIWSASMPICAQSKKDKLQQEQKQLQEEIDEIKASIKEAESKKTQTLSQLNSLKRKIEKRQRLINNVNDQLADIEGEIIYGTENVIQAREELKMLKLEYGKIIAYAYKKKTVTNELMFIFSAKDFHQAYSRMKYIGNYSSYRNEQASKVTSSITKINNKILTLNKIKDEKTTLVSESEKQNTDLKVEKTQQDEMVKKLKKDISNLRKDQEKKNAAAQQLKRQIEKIIQDEIRKKQEKKEKNRKESKDSKDNKEIEADEKEELALSSDFISNKGKLPWPVAKGHIVEHFGKHSHPLDEGLMIEKLGIDIKTSSGAEIRSVFKGKVSNVFSIPGMQQCVMIEHGNYFSVYAHLSLVYVKKGEMVNLKEAIGRVFYDEKEGEAITEFQIWKGNDKLNPEDWIQDK